MKQYKQVSLKHHEVSFLGWQVLLIYFVLNLTCIFLISAVFIRHQQFTCKFYPRGIFWTLLHIYAEAVVHGCSVKKLFCKKGALKNFAKFIGKHLCWSVFFNKVAGLKEKLMENN